MCLYIPAILALGSWKQEVLDFSVTFSYIPNLVTVIHETLVSKRKTTNKKLLWEENEFEAWWSPGCTMLILLQALYQNAHPWLSTGLVRYSMESCMASGLFRDAHFPNLATLCYQSCDLAWLEAFLPVLPSEYSAFYPNVYLQLSRKLMWHMLIAPPRQSCFKLLMPVKAFHFVVFLFCIVTVVWILLYSHGQHKTCRSGLLELEIPLPLPLRCLGCYVMVSNRQASNSVWNWGSLWSSCLRTQCTVPPVSFLFFFTNWSMLYLSGECTWLLIFKALSDVMKGLVNLAGYGEVALSGVGIWGRIRIRGSPDWRWR